MLTYKESRILVCLVVVFITLQILSLLFNQFFKTIYFLGMEIPFNVSVIFFCLGFFVLDLVTELYDNKVANTFIYGKILAQILFILCGLMGVYGADLQDTQLAAIIKASPLMVVHSIIATLIGYRLTTRIMQKLKIRYRGKHLTARYLVSTFPGEVVFSLVFSALSFASGRTHEEWFKIFISLTLVKLLLSIFFSPILTAITHLLQQNSVFQTSTAWSTKEKEASYSVTPH